MSDMLSRFDFLLSDSAPVAIVIQEWLQPAAGPDSVFFPPTFAPPEGSDQPAGYVIDGTGAESVCLIDTVGSQANRLEPIFKDARYSKLVPQITIKVGDRSISLLDAGHRAADAIARFSNLAADIEAAFLAYDSGDAVKLAKIAPSTLVFGAWDSRGTQIKIPRLIDSTIRAYGVQLITRNGQYRATLTKDEMEAMGIDGAALGKEFPAEEGLVDNPVKLVPGGILAKGGVRRDAVLNLVPLRAIGAQDEQKTLAVRRYVLALALVSLFAPTDFYLRQGCLLVRDPGKPARVESVERSGKTSAFTATFTDIDEYARAAAGDFGVGQDLQGSFNPELVKAKQAVKAAKKGKAKGTAASGRS